MKSIWRKHRLWVVVASIILLPISYGLLVVLEIAHLPDIAVGNHIARENDAYGSPVHLADLENRSVKESSGIASSRRNDNVLWTHNDSGDGPFIYAFDRRGKDRGTWRVAGADARDWEDIAIGPGPDRSRSYIYVGDIGDNSRRRDYIVVYRTPEPVVSSEQHSLPSKVIRETDTADVLKLKYPDGKHDAETLMVHPSTGSLYIVTKLMGAAPRVYKLKGPLPKSGMFTLAFVGEVQISNMLKGLITGGDISPDGRCVVLCGYLGASEVVLTARHGAAFDAIWKESPASLNIGSRRQGEAVCYRADGLAVLATSEGRPCPLIETVRKGQSP